MKVTRSFMITLFGCLLVAFASTPAEAQSDQQLRQENQRLRSEVDRLQKELDAAQATIDELRQQILSLQTGERTTGDPTMPVEEEKVSIDESEPTSSPRALLAALREDYQDVIAPKDMGAPNSAERELYLRAIDRWASRMAREHREVVDWHIHIEEFESSGPRGAIVKAYAVDPVHGTKLGPVFFAELPRNRIDLVEQGNPETMWAVRGPLKVGVVIAPNRQSKGSFDVPPFIGPFAELDLVFQLQNIRPASAETIANATGGNDGG